MSPSDAGAVAAMRAYTTELDRRFVHGFDVEAALAGATEAFQPPNGVFLVARAGDEVVGCGGIHWIDDVRGEIKRMWVAPTRRGSGLGSRLLARLEDEIATSGRRTVLLDTNSVLTEAIAMYRRAGYLDIEPYSDNPDAELWFEKRLA